ncbi:hypothetical protein EDD22DRAFT_543349 [Suillus occidentalis]|nr:hypothetical protein EDD22DRAFT_543349 [Suillus occidentalis]
MVFLTAWKLMMIHQNAEVSHPLTLSGLHPRLLFACLSSLTHRPPPQNDAPNELQLPSTPSRLHIHALLARLSSLLPHSQLNTEETEPHTVTPSRSDVLMGVLSSRVRSQPHANGEIEFSQCATCLHVIEVAPMRDREVLYVADPAQADRLHRQSVGPPHSRPIRLLGHIGLFYCCQGQSQGPV